MARLTSAQPPERTCLGCGRKKPKGELVRLALGQDGELVVDAGARAVGRGAYLCGAGCLSQAVKRKAFGRAFRGKAKPFSPSSIESALSGVTDGKR